MIEKNSLRRNAIYIGDHSRIYFDRSRGQWFEVPEGNFLTAYYGQLRDTVRANCRRAEGQSALTEAEAEEWWEEQETVDKIVD